MSRCQERRVLPLAGWFAMRELVVSVELTSAAMIRLPVNLTNIVGSGFATAWSF